MSEKVEERLVEPRSRGEWRAWLTQHADDGRGVWLVLHKGQEARLTYNDAVEEAVAAGWIDSKANKVDAARYKLWMAPRKKGSVWAPSNKERVARLTEQGLMTPRGLGIVEAAKADGSWEAMDAVMALEIPPDLRDALDREPQAAANFEAFPVSSKRIILGWIRQAKGAETRARRVHDTVRFSAQNIRPEHWRRPQAERPDVGGGEPK